MGILGWLKKAAKVAEKMTVEVAEEPEEKDSSTKCSQVPNPINDEYLERWNNRKPSQIINLEMPGLTFQTRYDFSKVRGYDFGMENNQITLILDGPNRDIAREDVAALNPFLTQGHMNNKKIPMFFIDIGKLRFTSAHMENGDYTRVFTLPLTPTGKQPKYPLMMSFCLLSQDEHWKNSTTGGEEIWGQIWYLNNGEIGKARVICWKYAKKEYGCYVFQIRRNKEGLYLMKVEQPTQS